MSRSFKSSLVTFLIVAGSSLFFCSKAVFVKLAYRYGLDAVTTLALRMAMAFPFFLIGGIWASSGKQVHPLTSRDWARLALLGFCGWYFSSVINFMGLEHVSVGLERMILYTYPSIVLLGSVIVLRKPLRWGVAGAMLLSYLGILIGYYGEASAKTGGETWLGALLVFGSAISYAIFVLMSGEMIARIGPIRFTSCVVGFSCLYVLIHFVLTHPPGAILKLPPGAYGCGVALAIAGTVIPSYLFGIGLKRAGAQAFAVIGMIGPLGTVGLAWMLLGEAINPVQVLGLALTLAGGAMVAVRK
ncbi:DMT family transporter [Verrucomicrobium spinosum]|uniref:DMT family transporter n=1 Tax=Verrucomicrobium spinosum TaxID=2736 RepID=UPI0001746344|nr:EamA family transporter [Verrucomicrobium spinosum]